ncbi:MAG TPA: SUMF1/EgtB/PvdO family nonheme iron enzyme [Bacteroidales bacterium]|nr:SUMF1/EgtB/PvdO family nonheme iron enzyme [Bacteroidales bacterium]HRX95908.1 SUMF1/EgtB/PvdO family nonheme iron enzyme [Bacteroidales bacterium]
MKRVFLYLAALIILGSCGNSGNGELVGVQNRKPYYQPTPYGMAYIPLGSYTMGAGEEDVAYALTTQPRTVTIAAFYMDETEVTNNEYRQFVYWVRDSIARVLLGDMYPEDYLIEEDRRTGEFFDPPFLNWSTRIDWDGEEDRDILMEMYLPEHERFQRKKEFDVRKFNYEYYWVDLQAAAKKDFSQDGNVEAGALNNRPQGLQDRSVYVRKEVVNVYPDTLAWLYDYSYSFNEPLTQKYFWHPAYDNYPVVGVNWRQAKAFCVWRTQLKNSWLASKKGDASIHDYRLPTEAEWEWAARGGHDFNPYPWGGPYTRNDKGCFLGNYKPLRGNYTDDGGATPIIVAHYPPNDWGLYDMSGNVAEWTADAFDESSYNFTWDLNPHYQYNADINDPAVLKRKVVRGGSWKDVGYYLQVSARTYEYQDTAKSYIGFRCVQPYLGRQKDDNPAKASHIYKK